MTKRLEQALEKAKALPEAQQNALAELILQEIAWEKTLAQSTSELTSLAQEALEEYRAGKTKPLTF
ncbi:MAG: hypothetical protein MUC38_04190 [Cyclobacteriaceae bacterium]|jgi:hypothetical protein|nr:hypothetical protein [Cyclobacteriaceae bacterium]